MKKYNVHFYPSPIVHETRMFKITRSIAELDLFDKIFLVGIWEPGLLEEQILDKNRTIIRIKLTSNTKTIFRKIRIVVILEWIFKSALKFKKYPLGVVSCHNLASLPLGVFFKLLMKSVLVYDTHEIETERIGWNIFYRKVSGYFESLTMYFVDVIFVVSRSIHKWYRIRYPQKKIFLMRNVPILKEIKNTSVPLRETLRLKKTELIFIYQGAICEGRSIDMLLDIFKDTEKYKHIVLMGFFTDNVLKAKILEYSSKYENIHYIDAVSEEKVLGITRTADIGLCIIENKSKSYYYTVANKLYEYILSGVPAVVSNFPDNSKIIKENKCGWVIPPNHRDIKKFIETVTLHDALELKVNMINLSSKFNWDNETVALKKLYRLFMKGKND